jgi:hypothetical protein
VRDDSFYNIGDSFWKHFRIGAHARQVRLPCG